MHVDRLEIVPFVYWHPSVHTVVPVPRVCVDAHVPLDTPPTQERLPYSKLSDVLLAYGAVQVVRLHVPVSTVWTSES